MKYKLIVFDLDGTLVNSIPDIADVFNTALADRGFPVHPQQDYYSFVGWGIKRALEMVLPEGFSDPHAFGQMLEEIHSRYFARPAKYSYVYSGISPLVEDLAERGVPMIVYTNKDQKIAEAVMEQLFPDVTFSAVIGLSGVFPAKPDPGALLSHITGKNLPLSSILMVGDTPVDRDTAVNAGVDFAGVTWGYRTAAELRETGSQLNFDQPVDLHNWLVEEEHNEF